MSRRFMPPREDAHNPNLVDFEVDHTRLIQKIVVPPKELWVCDDPRIATSDGKVKAWFNASVIDRDGLWMLYRAEAKPYFRFPQVSLIKLDDEFQPITDTNKLYSLQSRSKKLIAEDPRWIIHREELMFSYTDSYYMALGRFGKDWEIKSTEYLLRPNQSGQLSDKNWGFFDYKGELRAVYTITPHQIIKIDGVKTHYSDASNHHYTGKEPFWRWGIPRGGASPVLYNDVWWNFFHSSEPYARARDQSLMKQYHTGLYVFENKPPFNVLGVSKHPLFSASVIDETDNDRPSQHRVTFPCGAFRGKTGWWISYGKNDHRIHMRFIDDHEIVQYMRWF